jgi:hypothetical protein
MKMMMRGLLLAFLHVASGRKMQVLRVSDLSNEPDVIKRFHSRDLSADSMLLTRSLITEYVAELTIIHQRLDCCGLNAYLPLFLLLLLTDRLRRTQRLAAFGVTCKFLCQCR